MNDANDVAKYIVLCEANEGRGLTNLRLNAILFLVQSVYLYTYLKPCFNNKIYAWDAGPIIPDVYNRYKIYAGNKLTLRAFDDIFEYNIDDSTKRAVEIVLKESKEIETSEILDIIRRRKFYRIARQIYNSEITPAYLLKFYKEDFGEKNE